MEEWRYHQLGCFFKGLKPGMRPVSSLTAFESMCVNIPTERHLMSQMYRLILATQNRTVPHFIREWEGELGHNLTTAQIKKLFNLTHSTSISSQIQEMSYKFLTRWYWTPVKIAKRFPTADARCWRGCGQEGTFLHLWWSCPKIKVFWEAIASWVERLSPGPIEVTPWNFLFHGTSMSVRAYKNSVIPHLLNAAKSLIPRLWKQTRSPTLADWKKEVNLIMEAERWVHAVKDKKDKNIETWAGWVRCLKEIR